MYAYMHINTKNKHWIKQKGKCKLLTSFKNAILDISTKITVHTPPLLAVP